MLVIISVNYFVKKSFLDPQKVDNQKLINNFVGNKIGMDGKYSLMSHPHPSLASSLDIVTQVISKFISELKFNLVLSYYSPHIMLNFHILGEI